MGTDKNRPGKDGGRDAERGDQNLLEQEEARKLEPWSLKEKCGISRNFISGFWSLEQ